MRITFCLINFQTDNKNYVLMHFIESVSRGAWDGWHRESIDDDSGSSEHSCIILHLLSLHLKLLSLEGIALLVRNGVQPPLLTCRLELFEVIWGRSLQPFHPVGSPLAQILYWGGRRRHLLEMVLNWLLYHLKSVHFGLLSVENGHLMILAHQLSLLHITISLCTHYQCQII